MADDNLILTDPQPTRADAVKNRALLMDTARRLFAEHGVEAVPMSAIAEAANVGKGTLYRHFENKTALAHALLDHTDRQFQERVLEHLRMTVSNPLGSLRWFLVEIVAYIEQNYELLSVYDPSSIAALTHPAHWWWRQTIRGLLEQLHPPGDLDFKTDVLYVMIDIRTSGFLRQVRGYTVSQIQEQLLLLLDALLH
jgi:AcrR family transcriptional regulator